MTRRRQQPSRSRGRPRESIYTQPPPSAEQNLSFWLARQREDFLNQPEKMRAETLARVELLLDYERQQWEARGCCGMPSQLARIAYRVYGYWVEWLPAHWQLDPVALELSKNQDKRDEQIARALRSVLGEVVYE